MSVFKLIAEDFKSVYRRDPAIHSRFELFFNYPGVWAVANYRIANWFHRKGFKLFARFLMGLSQLITNIDIHPAATIGRRVFIDHGIGVVIGETAIIGDDVTIYQGATLGGVSLNPGKRHPTVERNVVIGAGAKVLGNITIGYNSKIGANSVVVRDVPPESTAVGIPAKVVTKGRDKSPLSHNKIPDINKELFEYLLKRVALIEHILTPEHRELLEKEQELDKIYEAFIQSMKQ
ncbi:serine O-acetyltransferase [Hydrogenimonas sp. SS33]|uniref:serine O-acetyltransferase n=1 Tax=Hydrogenimonas leucolamina TaxID=2954236 RepID=UPI00336BC4CE